MSADSLTTIELGPRLASSSPVKGTGRQWARVSNVAIMASKGTNQDVNGVPRVPASWWEVAGFAMLALLTVFFLAESWRKWPDPLIDFGRELYLPWRIAHGAVLYRDVDDFYGPLSQYLNAGLFALFGPGLMVLVTANLAIFGGILVTLYVLFRRAWGPAAAFVSSAIFISVFSFSQFDVIGNYSYAAPYAHEVTHGLLVCLLLTAVLPAWVECATPRRSFVAGGLFGLAAVLKPEIMLASGLVTLAALAARRWRRRLLPPRAIGAWAAGAALPTGGFAVYFSTRVPWRSAPGLACRAWLNVVSSTRFTGDPLESGFLGLDRPGRHLLEHAAATLLALLLVTVIAGSARLADRSSPRRWRWLVAVALAGGMAAIAWSVIPWANTGRCLLGLALIYVLMCAATLLSEPRPEEGPRTSVLRLLLAVLAAALMARMVLNGRISQFGFYQAALAALLVPAVLIGEMPAKLGAGRWGRAVAAAGCLGLLVPGVVTLAGESRQWLRMKTHPIGEGLDRFYSFTPQADPTGEIVDQTASWLRTRAGGQARTLLVLPQGEMINYLARLPSPVAPFFFFSAATRGDREAAIVRDLAAHPPEWIALVSCDLREYGVQRYGERPDQGGQILAWARKSYEPVATLGGDPLDFQERGALILQRKH